MICLRASGIPITNALIISEARREIVNEITIAISRISAAMHVGAISLLQPTDVTLLGQRAIANGKRIQPGQILDLM